MQIKRDSETICYRVWTAVCLSGSIIPIRLARVRLAPFVGSCSFGSVRLSVRPEPFAIRLSMFHRSFGGKNVEPSIETGPQSLHRPAIPLVQAPESVGSQENQLPPHVLELLERRSHTAGWANAAYR